MIKSTAEMLKKGYLLFPKVLFEEQIKVTKGATGYFDASILVLTHVIIVLWNVASTSTHFNAGGVNL